MDKSHPPPQQQQAKEFICPCCNIKHPTSDAMIEHIKQSPITVKTFSCNVCHLEFFLKSDLIDHQRLDHQMAVSKKYKCDECDMDYSSAVQLQRHKQMHDEITRKLAESGIFLPRPKPPIVEIKEELGSEGGQSNDNVYDPDDQGSVFCPKTDFSILTDMKPEQTDRNDQKLSSHTNCTQKIKLKQTDFESVVSPVQEKDPTMGTKKESRFKCNKKSGNKMSKKLKYRDTPPLSEEEDFGDDIESENLETEEDDNDPDYSLPGLHHRKKTIKRKRTRALVNSQNEPKSPKCKQTLSVIKHNEDPVMLKHVVDSKTEVVKSIKIRKNGNVRGTQRRGNKYPSLKKHQSTRKPSKPKAKEYGGGEDEVPPNIIQEDGTIQCPDCLLMCLSLNGLNRHRKNHFKTMKKLKCVFCEVIFENKDAMNKHMTSVHPLRKFGNAFMSRPNIPQFPCPEEGCTASFRGKSTLTKHRVAVHGLDRYLENTCPECGKQLSNQAELSVHMRMHTGHKPFKCDLCPKAFKTSSNLVLHRKTHSEKKPFTCEDCGRGFNYVNSLRRHIRCAHTGERPYMCDACGLTFPCHGTLSQHARNYGHGKLSLPGQYSCQQCGKRFRTESGVKNHAQGGSDGKCKGLMQKEPMICELCGRECSSKLTLKLHRMTHSAERPFKCRLCDATFRQHAARSNHEKVHGGKKDYACTMCEKTFYYRAALRGHMRRHINNACSTCGKTCGSPSELIRHQKRHDKQQAKGMKCPFCPASFRAMHRLTGHMNKQHPGAEKMAPPSEPPQLGNSYYMERSDSCVAPMENAHDRHMTNNHDLQDRERCLPWDTVNPTPVKASNDHLSDEEQYVVV